MKYIARLLLAVSAVAFVSIIVAHLFASRDRHEGQSLARWLLVEMRRSEALEYRATEMSQSQQVKKAVVGDLVAERLTLREAAEQFRQADQLIETDPTGLVAAYHTPETEEQLYRQVIAWAKIQLRNDREQAQQVIPRLEQEMAEQCGDEASAE
jgi:hypothetical protein